MKQRDKKLFVILIFLIIGSTITTLIFAIIAARPTKMNYYSCVKAGHPTTRSYPAQCIMPDGARFIEPVPSLIRTCPDAWYDNQMPSIGTPSANRDYLIIRGERVETADYDLDWISTNCKVNRPEIVQ